MKGMITDLDQGPERPSRAPDRVRLMHEERDRIQADGGTVYGQRWVFIGDRWVIRTRYGIPDDNKD